MSEFPMDTMEALISGEAKLGPRTSAIRLLLGETVTEADLLTDTSEFGIWRNVGPLEHRPPEFWVDQVHDCAYAGDESEAGW